MAEVVAASQRVNQLLGEVANGAREQSLGITQIGSAVQDLDRMTQQNAAASGAALAETSAAAAEPRTDEFDFDQAIEAHRQWRVKLREAIADKARLGLGVRTRLRRGRHAAHARQARAVVHAAQGAG